MISGSVEDLIEKKYLKSQSLIAAFKEIARADFVPSEFEIEAEADICLPIGCGQISSQPSVVAIMLELLDPQPKNHILDVGSGSGWTSALLGHVVGQEGKVVAIEHLPELHTLCEKNMEKFGLAQAGIVKCVMGNGYHGFDAFSPYDRILISGSLEEVPSVLKNQLKTGGKMVFPMHNHIWYLEKRGETEFYKEEYSGISFMPPLSK